MNSSWQKTGYTASIFLMMFAGAVCTTTQGVMLTNYIEYYHLESFEQGLMSAFQSGGNLAALVFIGILLQKLSKQGILLITAVAIPLVFFLFGLNPAFGILLAGYGVYGIAFGFLDSLASSMMVDLYQEKSSVYMNLLHASYGLGGLAGPLFLEFLEKRGLPWQQVLMAAGGLALTASIIFGINAFAFKGNGGARGEGDRLTPAAVAGFLKEKRKRILFFCAFLYGAHQIGITVWVVRYISEYLQAPQWGAAALSAFWVCAAAARLVVPRLGLRRKTVLVLGHLISGLAVAAGVMAGDGFVMLVCTGVCGFAEGTVLPMTLDMACHWEIENTSLGSSMVLLAHYLGFILAPMVMGGLIARFSVAAGMLLPAVLSLLAAGLIRTVQDE